MSILTEGTTIPSIPKLEENSKESNKLLMEGIEPQILTENAFTRWFAYYFKGYSNEETELFQEALENIKTPGEAAEVVEDIDEVIEKIKEGGDWTHTLGNWVAAFAFGLVLVIKHIIKQNFESDGKKEIRKLRDLQYAIRKKFNLDKV